MTEPLIEFVRLSEVSILEVLDVLNEPRNGRHLPLAGERFTEASARGVGGREGWAVGGEWVWPVGGAGRRRVCRLGWASARGERSRLALVLKPTHWGHGAAVTRAALTVGLPNSDWRRC